jgi:CRISPR/Cas system-associated exonuclease Cas4 (RecB family)
MMENKHTEDIEVLRNEILERRNKILASKIKKFRPNNFWASAISECDREMCYSILNWEDKQMYDEHLQARFDKGRQEEKNVIIELMDMGYDIQNTQLPIAVKNRKGEVICTGKLEGRIRPPSWKKKFVFEIKSMHPDIFKQINTYDDLDKKPWLRRYKRQIQVYLFGHNEEMGLLILTDCLGHWKIIPVYLDYGEAEFIIQRLERNWEFIKKNKLPNKMKFKNEICSRCNFNHICLPDLENTMAELVDSKDIEAQLERRKELHPLAREYNKIDEELKEVYKKSKRDVIIGINWRIITTRSEYQAFDSKLVPDSVQLKYMGTKERITVDFVDLREVKDKGKKDAKKKTKK